MIKNITFSMELLSYARPGRQFSKTKKRLIAVCAVLFFVSGAAAQELKFFGGRDWAKYKIPPGPGFELYSIYRTNPGFLAGLGLEFSLLSALNVDVGLVFFQKGAKADVYYLTALIGLDTYGLNVVSLPACLKLKPFFNLPPYIIAGGEISYVLSHHDAFTSTMYEPRHSDLTPATRRFDFGLVLGGGAETALAQRWTAFVELRYILGLVNLGKPGIMDFKTRALAVQAGIKYSLSRKQR
jgi:opacity protein-like surface antigen